MAVDSASSGSAVAVRDAARQRAFESSLPALEPGDVLSDAQPWNERLMLSFRQGDSSRGYMMNVAFDADLLSVGYAIDTDPRGHELLNARRRRQSLFMDADGFLLTGEEAAKLIVRSLLVGWWPASSTAAAA